MVYLRGMCARSAATRSPEAEEVDLAGHPGLAIRPAAARALYVLAHGAGAGMRHEFMATIAAALAERDVATLRWEFPYMAAGKPRPDRAEVAEAAVQEVWVAARARFADLALFAGGKSFGGRMTSRAHAARPLADLRGLIFLGFPLHPPGRPSDERARHLFEVHIPMLFLQGTRDELAELQHLRPVVEQLGTRATLKLFPEADHSFHVPARTGRKDADVRAELLDALAGWIDKLIL